MHHTLSTKDLIEMAQPVPDFDINFTLSGEDNDYNQAQKILTHIQNAFDSLVMPSFKDGKIIQSLYGSIFAVNYLKKHREYRDMNLDDIPIFRLSPMHKMSTGNIILGIVEIDLHAEKMQRLILNAFKFSIVDSSPTKNA
jgi:hypothetical protein